MGADAGGPSPTQRRQHRLITPAVKYRTRVINSLFLDSPYIFRIEYFSFSILQVPQNTLYYLRSREHGIG